MYMNQQLDESTEVRLKPVLLLIPDIVQSSVKGKLVLSFEGGQLPCNVAEEAWHVKWQKTKIWKENVVKSQTNMQPTKLCNLPQQKNCHIHNFCSFMFCSKLLFPCSAAIIPAL